MGSATALTDCELLQIDKKAMTLALHREHTFSDLFVPYLLARNIRYEEDLTLQFQRKKTSSGSDLAGSFRQGRRARDRNSQDQSGDSGRDDWHNPVAGQFFREQIQEDGFHSLQRWIAGPQLTPECRSPRLASEPKSYKQSSRIAMNKSCACWI